MITGHYKIRVLHHFGGLVPGLKRGVTNLKGGLVILLVGFQVPGRDAPLKKIVPR